MKRIKWHITALSTHKKYNTNRLQRRLQRLSAATYRLMQKYELSYIDVCMTKCKDDNYLAYRAKSGDAVIADAYTFDRRRKPND